MSEMKLDAYLFFMGNCRPAMEYYHGLFGGKLTVQEYDAVPGQKFEGMKGKIMHADLSGGDIELMASDSSRKDPFHESFISLSLSGSDDEKLRATFDKLAEGGKVTMPLKKESWGDVFGSLTDKFGVDWMININAESK